MFDVGAAAQVEHADEFDDAGQKEEGSEEEADVAAQGGREDAEEYAEEGRAYAQYGIEQAEGFLAVGAEEGHGRDQSREEEEQSDAGDECCGHVVGEGAQQGSDDDGAEGAQRYESLHVGECWNCYEGKYRRVVQKKGGSRP